MLAKGWTCTSLSALSFGAQSLDGLVVVQHVITNKRGCPSSEKYVCAGATMSGGGGVQVQAVAEACEAIASLYLLVPRLRFLRFATRYHHMVSYCTLTQRHDFHIHSQDSRSLTIAPPLNTIVTMSLPATTRAIQQASRLLHISLLQSFNIKLEL